MTLWQRGVRQELPALGERFPYTGPLDMNKRGQIVAQSIDATFSIARPYLWENGAARDLGGLYDQPCPNDPQMPCGSANISSINDHGDIVGYSWDSNGNNRAVIWRGGGAVADLGVFPGEFTMSQQINEKGDIYGFGGPDHWWVLSKGVLMGPGNPPGAFSHPSAMNNRGEVIGFIRGADGEGHAFVWREGQLTDLGGGAPGSRLSEAWDINDRGEILGAYYTQDFEQHVVVWRPVNGKAVASNP
jgi:probable HAF family extracellular repeat protein